MKNNAKIFSIVLFFGLFGLLETSQAATLYMPDTCSSFSACVSRMKSGDTLVIRDGTYRDSISGVKAGTTVAAEHDGKVIFTGSFDPGTAGFIMQGIIVKSSSQKDLGVGNTYRRMSFVGGPSCGNTKNSAMGSNTKIYESAFYGQGGRYLLYAYKQNGGITIQDVIFRPDGGWGNGAGCNEYEPQAAYNMYDTEGFTITGAILIDAISTASRESEILGGQVVNTHQGHGNVGTISQSVITACSNPYGRFASDGNGSHDVSIVDSVAKANGYKYGLTRNCGGTTTATRFETDSQIGEFDGRINRTTGSNLVLNIAFLNDPRWKREMCSDAGVSRGLCATSMNLGSYVANKLGTTVGGTTPPDTPPAAPTNLHVISN